MKYINYRLVHSVLKLYFKLYVLCAHLSVPRFMIFMTPIIHVESFRK